MRHRGFILLASLLALVARTVNRPRVMAKAHADRLPDRSHLAHQTLEPLAPDTRCRPSDADRPDGAPLVVEDRRADAADTVLEINLDGQSYRLSAYALAEAADGGVAPAIEVPPADVAGRAAMREFIDALTGMPADGFVDEQHPYAFDALRLYVTKAAIVENSEFPGEQPRITWPLDDLAAAGEPVENSPLGARCLVVEGDELATIKPLPEGANQLSVFESEGEFYSLIPRPLYPDESGC